MLTAQCLGVNEHGHLTLGGADCVTLAGEYGTPLYLLDEGELRRNCKAFVSAARQSFGEGAVVAYASKALCCKELCRIAKSEGLYLDVVSGGELYTAMSAGFPPENVFFHGNNKTAGELVTALEQGVGLVVVDNIEELRTLDALGAARGKRQPILLRIKPGVEAHTHKYVVTGSIDSKFGFALENGEAAEAVRLALASNGVRLDGLHCHIGSQIFETEPFCEAARVMLRFIKQIKDETSAEMSLLNLGGGFGIKYVEANDPLSPEAMLAAAGAAIDTECAALGMTKPRIAIEPGRAIVGPAGVTLYTVGSVKNIEGVRSYVAVDGGMPDNPRYALYGSEYTALVANKSLERADFKATIAGRCCESGDLLQENAMIQRPEPGDILAVLGTGAYNYSMSSNYNRLPKPPIVMISEGKPRVIVRGESYEDVAAFDI